MTKAKGKPGKTWVFKSLVGGVALVGFLIVGFIARPWFPWLGAQDIRVRSVSEKIENRNIELRNLGQGASSDFEAKEIGPELENFKEYLSTVSKCYNDYALQRRKAGYGRVSLMYYHNNIKAFKDRKNSSRIIFRFTGTGPDMHDFVVYYLCDVTTDKIIGIERGYP